MVSRGCFSVGLLVGLVGLSLVGSAFAADVVHDAEYYILEAQHRDAWKIEDGELDSKLAELRTKYGTPPLPSSWVPAS